MSDVCIIIVPPNADAAYFYMYALMTAYINRPRAGFGAVLSPPEESKPAQKTSITSQAHILDSDNDSEPTISTKAPVMPIQQQPKPPSVLHGVQPLRPSAHRGPLAPIETKPAPKYAV